MSGHSGCQLPATPGCRGPQLCGRTASRALDSTPPDLSRGLGGPVSACLPPPPPHGPHHQHQASQAACSPKWPQQSAPTQDRGLEATHTGGESPEAAQRLSPLCQEPEGRKPPTPTPTTGLPRPRSPVTRLLRPGVTLPTVTLNLHHNAQSSASRGPKAWQAWHPSASHLGPTPLSLVVKS